MQMQYSLVITSCTTVFRVVKVTEKTVEVLDKKTHQTSLHPYGLIVWSTGVAPLPLTKSICESLPEQNNK